MAKKKETTKVEVAPEVKATVAVEKPTVKTPAKPKWEIKDRIYYLKGNKKPLSRSIRSANIFYFDEDKGYERELKYCENQRTPFVDEMKGDQRLSHILFRNGALFVEKNKTTLQKLLSLYHPDNDKLYYEYKPIAEAAGEIEEAIMRVEKGSEVSRLSSKELKRDLLVFARNNPALFLELLEDDNVVLRNFGIKAVEEGIIKLSSDQRNFTWGSNNRKIMTVPFDEHPYTALAHWFKTDEGMEIYSNIEKRFNS
jgi:hypothetical protein